MIQKNVIKFKEDIDFNYISKFLDMNTYTSQFSGLWYEERIFQSVMQIRSVQKHPKFKKIYNYLDKQFDIVFTSYGTIGWLPDIDKWAKIVSKFLKPNGQFVFVEFHPIVWMFDDNFENMIFL